MKFIPFALSLGLLITTVYASDEIYIEGINTNAIAKEVDGQMYIPADIFNISQDDGKLFIHYDLDKQISDLVDKIGKSVVAIIGNYGGGVAFGSGVIYKNNGYIITNAHVVKNVENIVVVLHNGKSYHAKLRAIDEMCDLAMIKIDKGGLTPAVFSSNENITQGQTTIAIGTPLSFSLRNTVTKGIVSGFNRSADGYYKLIQTDTPINQGNSGGPLVNLKGEVIGINSSKYIGYGVESTNFSIPIDTVKYALDHFEKYGKIRRPYVGIEFSEGIAAQYGLPTNEGIIIKSIEKDSPAENYGLKIDDVLISVNDSLINTVPDYYETVKKYLPGDTVKFLIDRDGELLEVYIEYSEKAEEE